MALQPTESVNPKEIKQAIQGIIKCVSDNPKVQNQLFNEEFPLFLQINAFKVPKAQGEVKQVFRIPLANSPLPTDPDICLIVPDVKGIPNKEHERHVEHYESLLRAKDVTGIKKIMTFHEFRTEYDTFELKNRLVDLYDAFLVDGRISGKVVHKCGSIFYKKRKLPVAIKLLIPKLKAHIEQALNKVFFQLNLKSDSSVVQFGHSKMGAKQLVQNIQSILGWINKEYPGNMKNVRSLNVYAHRGGSIPIYLSIKNPNEIEVPIIREVKSKSVKTETGELTTQYNASVVVKPSGQVIVKRKNASKQEQEAENVEETEVKSESVKIPKKRKLSSHSLAEESEAKSPKIEKKTNSSVKLKAKAPKVKIESSKIKKIKKPKVSQEKPAEVQVDKQKPNPEKKTVRIQEKKQVRIQDKNEKSEEKKGKLEKIGKNKNLKKKKPL